APHELRAKLAPGEAAVLIIPTKPLEWAAPPPSDDAYREVRRACADAWRTVLDRGMRLEIPEPIVPNARPSLVRRDFPLAVGDRMNYSAHNAYDHLYEAECGDAARSLMLFGFDEAARGMLGPLLDFQRQATRVHVAGHKLQLLAHYYWVTRDADTVRAREP